MNRVKDAFHEMRIRYHKALMLFAVSVSVEANA